MNSHRLQNLRIEEFIDRVDCESFTREACKAAMAEREEKVEVSDARIVEEIKKAEEDDYISLRLSQLKVTDAVEESVMAAEKLKEEQEESGMSRKEKLKNASYTLYGLEKDLMKKLFEIWNPYTISIDELEDLEDSGTIEREKRRKLDLDQVDFSGVRQQIEKDAQDSGSSREGKEKKVADESDNRVFRALESVSHVMLEYSNYMDHIFQMASEKGKNVDDWTRHFENGAQVLLILTESIKKAIIEMAPMKKNVNQVEDYIKIHRILFRLVRMNARLDRTPIIAIASQRDCSEFDLVICEHQLKLFKYTLFQLMTRLVKIKLAKLSPPEKMCPKCDSDI